MTQSAECGHKPSHQARSSAGKGWAPLRGLARGISGQALVLIVSKPVTSS